MPQRPSARGLIWRNGIIFGLMVPAVGTAIYFTIRQLGIFAALANTGNLSDSLIASSAFFICGTLLQFSLLFVAGMLTARATGSVGAATLTGLVAGGVEELLPVIFMLIVIIGGLRSELQGQPPANQAWANLLNPVSLIFALLIGLINGCAIGAGLGALGGLVGRNTYLRANPPLPYQGAPNPPYLAPPAPGQQPPMTPPPYPPQYPPQNPPQQG